MNTQGGLGLVCLTLGAILGVDEGLQLVRVGKGLEEPIGDDGLLCGDNLIALQTRRGE